MQFALLLSHAMSRTSRTLCQFAGCLVALAAAGCDQEQPTATVEITQPAGYLPRLKMAQSDALRAALEELAAHRDLPEDIRRPPLPKERNAATSLQALIPESSRKKLFDETLGFFPTDDLQFSPTNWERAVRFLEKHESTRASARKAVANKDCDLQIDHTLALTEDLSIVYALHAIARLEAIYAVQQLKSGDLAASLEGVAAMLKLSQCLDQQTHVTCRMQAIHIRSDAILVLEAICQHELLTNATLLQASQMIEAAIGQLPDERDAWRSDRAMSLICYEYAMAGSISNVLTDEELAALSDDDRGSVARFRGLQIEADLISYLDAMRNVIEQSELPLFRREGIALQLPAPDPPAKNANGTMSSKAGAPKFSLAQILIDGVPQGQGLFALDEARLEAWLIGLKSALGQELLEFQISPLSGQPYTVLNRDETIAVWGVGAVESGWDRPVVINKLQ